MKVLELFEARGRSDDLRSGTWTVHNMMGVPKKFKNIDSAEARAWMKSRDLAPEPKNRLSDWERQQRQWEKEDRAEERAAARAHRAEKKSAQDLTYIYNKVTDAVGAAFPDGDPLDRLMDWMEKYDITMEMINKAFKKWEKKTYYKYLEDMWDSMADDAIFDAENGHFDNNSPYYSMEIKDPAKQKEYEEALSKYQSEHWAWREKEREHNKYRFVQDLHGDKIEHDALKNIPKLPPKPEAPDPRDYGVMAVKNSNPWKHS